MCSGSRGVGLSWTRLDYFQRSRQAGTQAEQHTAAAEVPHSCIPHAKFMDSAFLSLALLSSIRQ